MLFTTALLKSKVADQSKVISKTGRLSKVSKAMPTATVTTATAKNVETREFLNQLDAIDSHADFEISGGNAVASIDHDGVELSVHGSDLDEFSDEELTEGVSNLDSQPQPGTSGVSNRSGRLSMQDINREQGEIMSSDDEQPPLLITTRPMAMTTKGNGFMHKFQHLQDDPEFNTFLDKMLDKKLSSKADGQNKGNPSEV